MKLNLFGGLIVFEGTTNEFKELDASIEGFGGKLFKIQEQINLRNLELQKNNPFKDLIRPPQEAPPGRM
jgi:hypothetical protein